MPSRLKVVFFLDAALLASICALETVPFTGMIIHEWLGIILALIMTVHLLLSWSWIASSTRRLLTGASSRTRVNYLLNFSLFACMTTLIYSGIQISQQAVPFLTRATGGEPPLRFPWGPIHDTLSNVVVVLAGLHLAINWEWIRAATRKLWLARETSS
jgi:cytochrome b